MPAVAKPYTVVQLLPALESGGVERAVLEIAEALVRAGHRAIVVSAGGRLVPDLQRLGARHITLAIGDKSLLALRHLAALRRILRDADIVHARSRLPAWLGWLAWKSLASRRPRWVTTVHGLNTPGFYSSIMVRGERVIAVSRTVRDYLLQHYPRLDADRIRLIARGMDPQRFPSGHRAAGDWRGAFERDYPESAGKTWICLPGRGTRLKGHDDALQLLAGLRARGENVCLILLGAAQAGREVYLDALRVRAAELQLSAHLVITPPRADVCDVMSESALVLQLSRKPEAFGRTVVEALHMGVPVLGWAHGGVGELLAELYPEGAVRLGDHSALLQRALGLLQAPTVPAPFAGYRIEQMQAATLAVYQELLDEVAP